MPRLCLTFIISSVIYVEHEWFATMLININDRCEDYRTDRVMQFIVYFANLSKSRLNKRGPTASVGYLKLCTNRWPDSFTNWSAHCAETRFHDDAHWNLIKLHRQSSQVQVNNETDVRCVQAVFTNKAKKNSAKKGISSDANSAQQRTYWFI